MDACFLASRCEHVVVQATERLSAASDPFRGRPLRGLAQRDREVTRRARQQRIGKADRNAGGHVCERPGRHGQHRHALGRTRKVPDAPRDALNQTWAAWASSFVRQRLCAHGSRHGPHQPVQDHGACPGHIKAVRPGDRPPVVRLPRCAAAASRPGSAPQPWDNGCERRNPMAG